MTRRMIPVCQVILVEQPDREPLLWICCMDPDIRRMTAIIHHKYSTEQHQTSHLFTVRGTSPSAVVSETIYLSHNGMLVLTYTQLAQEFVRCVISV